MNIIEEKLIHFIAAGIFFAALILWEVFIPDRKYNREVMGRSYLTNVLVLILNNVTLSAFNITAIYALVSGGSAHLFWLDLPVWLQVVLGVVILDLVLYVWHVLSHRVPILWAVHQAHHSEKYLNATSAVRFHIGELVLSLLFKASFLFLTGIPLWIFALNEVLITMFAAFHHANMKLPKKVQKILAYIIITPNLHRTHHSVTRKEHDTNYGVIFSWWDRIFRTRSSVRPSEIGLSYFGEQRLREFLVTPFTQPKNK